MKKGETYAAMEARAEFAAACIAHRAAVAEGRTCACEAGHTVTCMAGGPMAVREVADFFGVGAAAV